MVLHVAVFSKDFDRDFATVFITAATEAKYGNFPFDRSLLAQAVERAAEAGAKGVVLKFFLDQPRSAKGDQQLAASISHIPVVLQARLDDAVRLPNPLEPRFTMAGNFKTAISGSRGWIPLPELSRQAHDICFVDFDSFPAPIVEQYQGRAVKSLLLCSAEVALGAKGKVGNGAGVSVGDQRASLDSLNRFTTSVKLGSQFASFEFNDLVEGRIPSATLKDKVVIIGYDGKNIPQFPTAAGPMGAHRLFVHYLRAFYDALSPAPRAP
jgi:CHASE2 domain-containing sensor protein